MCIAMETELASHSQNFNILHVPSSYSLLYEEEVYEWYSLVSQGLKR